MVVLFGIYNPGDDLAMVHGSPALSSDGTLYIPMCNVDYSGGCIVAVNISTGSEVWRRGISSGWGAESSPTIGSDGTIYIGSSHGGTGLSGYLYAFGLGYPNHPPGAPVINGPHSGKPGVVYNFSVYAIDPDGDNVTYHILWGGSSEVVGPFPSGYIYNTSHSWDKRGEYSIDTYAVDEYGARGDYTRFFIKISYDKNPLLQIFKKPFFYPFKFREFFFFEIKKL